MESLIAERVLNAFWAIQYIGKIAKIAIITELTAMPARYVALR
jgi:hypothetical protein